MAKRSDKGPKAQKAAASKTGGRWTVRGVPVRLQRAAGDAARAQGLTVGQWLNKLLASATERSGGAATAAPIPGWEERLEQRLARLEAAVFEATDAALPPVPERSQEPSADPAAA